MKQLTLVLFPLLAISVLFGSVTAADTIPVTMKYLGEATPGNNPVRFAAGMLNNKISRDEHVELHGAPVIMPGGTELYVEMQTKNRGTNTYRKTIMVSRWQNQKWQPLVPAVFSGTFNDGTLSLSPDGKRMYFSSDRPVTGKKESPDRDIWYVERIGDSWSVPVHLPRPINSDRIEGSIVFSGADRVFFFRRFKRENGSAQIMESRIVNGQFTTPKILPGTVNSADFDVPVLASNDGHWLIFYSNRGFPEAAGLYITFRNNAGQWTPPTFLPPFINDCGMAFTASLSPDKQYLFFLNRLTSETRIPTKPGERPEGIYWMQFPSLLEQLTKFENKWWPFFSQCISFEYSREFLVYYCESYVMEDRL